MICAFRNCSRISQNGIPTRPFLRAKATSNIIHCCHFTAAFFILEFLLQEQVAKHLHLEMLAKTFTLRQTFPTVIFNRLPLHQSIDSSSYLKVPLVTQHNSCISRSAGSLAFKSIEDMLHGLPQKDQAGSRLLCYGDFTLGYLRGNKRNC